MYASLASRRRSVLTQPGLQVFAVNDPKHEQDTLGIEQVVREPVVPDPQAAEGICGALNSKCRSERHRARTDQRVRGRRPRRLHPDPSGNRADRRLVRHNEKRRARAGLPLPLRLDGLQSSPAPGRGGVVGRAETPVDVVVDHADVLHERVHTRRPDEAVPLRLQLLRELLRLRDRRG